MNLALNLLILILFPFLLLGIINKIKAFWAGKKGPRILQPLYTCIKLLRKDPIYSETTTYIFQLFPIIFLASVILASMLIPLINQQAFIAFEGDWILFLYILALAKFFSLLSAMDTGSAFEGMGASREATFSVIAEPAIFLMLASLSLSQKYFSFSSVLNFFSLNISPIYLLVLPLSVIILFILILTEGCRIPVDDPQTHLELTMVHEVMVLDNAGADLAIIQFANALKMVLFSTLIANFVFPVKNNLLLSFAMISLTLLLIAFIIGTIEAMIPRLRMPQVPKFIFLLNSLAMVVAVLIFLAFFGGL
jgi:formate hydrogenlyase subunit 4